MMTKTTANGQKILILKPLVSSDSGEVLCWYNGTVTVRHQPWSREARWVAEWTDFFGSTHRRDAVDRSRLRATCPFTFVLSKAKGK
jgi:hypothetical protein